MDIEFVNTPERANDNKPNPEKGHSVVLSDLHTVEGVVDEIKFVNDKDIGEPYTKVVNNDVQVGGSAFVYREKILEIHVPEKNR